MFATSGFGEFLKLWAVLTDVLNTPTKMATQVHHSGHRLIREKELT